METFEDHPWCPYDGQSGDEQDHHHVHNLAKVRARSNSRSRRRSSFLVDELDMLMDKAATTIQATWRGYVVRKQLLNEHAAASTIQAAWRRFINREYMDLQRDQVPSWQMRGRSQKRRTPSPVCSEDGRRSWGRSQAAKERAAEVIQAHYRGYTTRRDLYKSNKAAITIQAHWRAYRTRQDLALRQHYRLYYGASPQEPLGAAYFGHPSYPVGGLSGLGPSPRKHWRKCMVGGPDEWAAKTPTQSNPSGKPHPAPNQQKTCPRCGRCTAVRVLVGVGKGPRSESELDDSEYEGQAHSPSAQRRARQTRSQEKQKHHHPPGTHVSYQTGPQSYYPETPQPVPEDQPRRQGRDPGGLSQRYAMHTTVRPSRERNTTRSLSSTSVRQQGPPGTGTSDWLYENYCTRRTGEGQRRVFKTRKHAWEVARAATLIQALWRGWQARRALRQQQEAAIRIQSAYRGYKTRAYLIEAGVLSEGDTD